MTTGEASGRSTESSLLADFEFAETLIKSVVETAMRQGLYSSVGRGGAVLSRFAAVRDDIQRLVAAGLSEEAAVSRVLGRSSSDCK